MTRCIHMIHYLLGFLGLIVIFSHLYVLSLTFWIFWCCHIQKDKKKHLEKDLCDGFATISDVDVVLLNQIYMLLSLLLSPSLAHLEGSAIIRRSPNKSKLKQASATIAIEKQSKLTDSVKASRTLTQSAADAYGSISPWGWLMCVCFFVSGKLIYYYSHPAPLHALLSICTVVLAVCSNLLLF